MSEFNDERGFGAEKPVAPELETEAVEPEAKTPLLKKEISFRRKPKQPKQPKKPGQPKQPKAKGAGLKREISFRRKPKAEKQAFKPKEKAPRRQKSASRKRAKRLVGLKIGGSQLAAARVVNNGVPELVQVAREPLESGIIVGGELREPELLADSLRVFFRKHKLPRQGVRLGIANNRIGVRILEIAGIDDPKQLENAIRYRAQEALPIPIEEAVLDYHVLGERVDDEGQRIRRVLLVVAYRELIDRYVAACKKAGVRLAGIDLEAFALLRALGEPTAGTSRRRMRRSSSSRSATTARPSPSRTDAFASSRAFSTGAARPSTSPSRASSTARPPRPNR